VNVVQMLSAYRILLYKCCRRCPIMLHFVAMPVIIGLYEVYRRTKATATGSSTHDRKDEGGLLCDSKTMRFIGHG